ncbi:class I SAM-dependent methyltransferase [soil metagenome]
MFELEDRYWWFVARRQLALNLLRPKLPPNAQVLDLGCGTGVISRELSAFSDPISLDMSAKALQYCQTRGLRECVQADGTKLPLQSGKFDAVLGLDIFEHIDDDLAAFQESFRVLNPGGQLVLSVPAFKSLWGPHDVALHHFRRYRKSQMEERLKQAGFQIDRSSYSVFFLFPVVVVSRVIEKFKSGPSRASLPRVPYWLNSLLIKLQKMESVMIVDWKMSLPWGSSVVVVASKPK